jgi:hypothetical protein
MHFSGLKYCRFLVYRWLSEISINSDGHITESFYTRKSVTMLCISINIPKLPDETLEEENLIVTNSIWPWAVWVCGVISRQIQTWYPGNYLWPTPLYSSASQVKMANHKYQKPELWFVQLYEVRGKIRDMGCRTVIEVYCTSWNISTDICIYVIRYNYIVFRYSC